jgi:hypothetical protein
LHELVEPEGVRQSVDGVELTGHEDAFEYLVVGEAGCSKRIDVLIGDLVGVLGELEAEPEERLVLLLDRQRLDIRRFGRLRRLLAASYRPQEK